MATFGLTSTGLNLPRAADFIARVQARFEELQSEELDDGTDLVLRNFLVAVGDEFDIVVEAAQSIYDALDENNATGAQLDSIAAICPGIDRLGASRSQITMTLTGTAGETLPVGALVEWEDTGARFALAADATFDDEGTVDAVFTAEDLGSVQGPAGTYAIVTPLEGWTSAVAAAKASVGRDRETDDELRIRRRLSMQIAGGRSLGALLGAVLALPFITDAVAIENDTNVTQVVQGVELPANSFSVVVLPDPLTDEQATTLVQLIYALAPMGIQSFGTQTATASKADGGEKSVAFSYPTGQNVSTQITYAVLPGYNATVVEGLVDAAVDTFFGLLGPGDTVRRLDLVRYVGAAVAGLARFDVDFNGLTDEDVEVSATKVAVRTSTGSTLTQV